MRKQIIHLYFKTKAGTLCYWTGLLILLLLIGGCNTTESALFEVRTAETTGLTFNNVIQPYINDSLNSTVFEYVYNGGGVATGDFNNDGLLDLYFAGNIVSSKLFLNKGDLTFTDITQASGTGTTRWATGVSVVDINNDGWNDLYVCVAGKTTKEHMANLLFVNQGLNQAGLPVFKEEAAAWGLADTGYSTMAAFFDYDKDGDLDLYLLTNSLEKSNRNNLRIKSVNGESENTDRLYRNNGNSSFTNVSRDAGILIEGWGLGVSIADINLDGWPDIYVANDFISNDLLWINQGNGSFINKAADYFEHQTYNGMGVDVADYNNDLLPDIVVLDMLPRDNKREKTMIARGGHDYSEMQDRLGYQKQYMRNTLQLNQGTAPSGDILFSEVGYLAGVFRTDWSWAPLLADFDNDGLKDLFIANGYRKDVTNLDFMVYHEGDYKFQFGSAESKERIKFENINEAIPEVKIHNFMYRNNGDLTFEDVSVKWGFSLPTYSNGTIYADLDNDGDLDLVSNNIDETVILYENTLYRKGTANLKNAAHYLRVNIAAAPEDLPKTYGAKVQLSIKGKKQYLEFNPYRGYKSTVEPFLHFGLGSAQVIDTLTVVWPDQRVSQQLNVAANQLITLAYPAATGDVLVQKQPERLAKQKNYLFKELTLQSGLQAVGHKENYFIDFKTTPMLHKMLSMDGPYMAVGDLNNDGLEDVVLGGDAEAATQILWQQIEGNFKARALPVDSLYEDQGIFIFDANGDGHNDLYIVSGGSQFEPESSSLQDRLYLNDGTGNFTHAVSSLPNLKSSGSVVKGADMDGDGDIDLFIGGRLVPMEYPLPARSYLLRNDGGTFVDVTREYAPELEKLGLVTDAAWVDLDNSGSPDLVVVGEWMPVTVFNNANGKFTNTTATLGLEQTHGLYYSVQVADLDKDGYADLILGNSGLNSYYTASKEQPLEIFAKDFDGNGSIDPVLTHYNQDKRYISLFRDRANEQIVGIKKRFPKYEDFGKATFDESFTKKEMEGAYHGICTDLSSYVLENKQGKSFQYHRLPAEAQFSAVRGIEVADLDRDGKLDLLIVGNSYAEESVRGWFDASYGYFLSGNGDFSFNAVKPSASGFIAGGDTRQMKALLVNGKKHVIVCRNNGPVSIFAVSDTPAVPQLAITP